MNPNEIAKNILAKRNESPRTRYLSFLVYGGMGSGKTYSLSTARKPIFVHSFDYGGTKLPIFEPLREKGLLIDDTQFEMDDPRSPSAFKRWDEEFNRLRREGFFEAVGTYVIDSATTWAQSAMWEILKRQGRTGGVPQQNDWLPQMVLLENAINAMLNLPCDVILICHDNAVKDEVTGKLYVSILITGKLVRRIPLLFDEIYHAEVKDTSKGPQFYFRTRRNSTYEARTRIGGGVFDELEKPDFKYLMQKAGIKCEDKEPFKL